MTTLKQMAAEIHEIAGDVNPRNMELLLKVWPKLASYEEKQGAAEAVNRANPLQIVAKSIVSIQGELDSLKAVRRGILIGLTAMGVSEYRAAAEAGLSRNGVRKILGK